MYYGISFIFNKQKSTSSNNRLTKNSMPILLFGSFRHAWYSIHTNYIIDRYLYVLSEVIVLASRPNFEILTNESNNDSLWSVSLGTKVVISQGLNVTQI